MKWVKAKRPSIVDMTNDSWWHFVFCFVVWLSLDKPCFETEDKHSLSFDISDIPDKVTKRKITILGVMYTNKTFISGQFKWWQRHVLLSGWEDLSKWCVIAFYSFSLLPVIFRSKVAWGTASWIIICQVTLCQMCVCKMKQAYSKRYYWSSST